MKKPLHVRVARSVEIRILIAFAAHRNMNLLKTDVKTTFFHNYLI